MVEDEINNDVLQTSRSSSQKMYTDFINRNDESDRDDNEDGEGGGSKGGYRSNGLDGEKLDDTDRNDDNDGLSDKERNEHYLNGQTKKTTTKQSTLETPPPKNSQSPRSKTSPRQKTNPKTKTKTLRQILKTLGNHHHTVSILDYLPYSVDYVTLKEEAMMRFKAGVEEDWKTRQVSSRQDETSSNKQSSAVVPQLRFNKIQPYNNTSSTSASTSTKRNPTIKSLKALINSLPSSTKLKDDIRLSSKSALTSTFKFEQIQDLRHIINSEFEMQNVNDKHGYEQMLIRMIKLLPPTTQSPHSISIPIPTQSESESKNERHIVTSKLPQHAYNVSSKTIDRNDEIQSAKAEWFKLVNSEIIDLSAENGVDLVYDIGGDGDGAGGKSIKVRHLYDSNDLLKMLSDIPSSSSQPITATTATPPSVSVFKINCNLPPPPSFKQLRSKFSSFNPVYKHHGIDDTFVNTSGSFISDRQGLGTKLIASFSFFSTINENRKDDSDKENGIGGGAGKDDSGRSSLLKFRRYARQGLPDNLRPTFYRLLLGLSPSVTANEEETYNRIISETSRGKKGGGKMRLVYPVIEALYRMDVKKNVECDTDFFPFYEVMVDVVHCLIHGSDYSSNYSSDSGFDDNIFHKMSIPLKDDNTQKDINVEIPPGNMPPPFKNSIAYITPLLLIHHSPIELYSIMNKLNDLIFTPLNTISSSPSQEGCILRLCNVFEHLLYSTNTSLYHHLLNLGVYPLDIAFQWIHLSFNTYLPPLQILRIYDYILSYNSLLILPLLCVGIFELRSEELLKCHGDKGKERVVKIISEKEGAGRINVVAVMQAMLFPECFK